MSDTAIKTPETHPDHDTVGHRFKGPDFYSEGWPWREWFCDSYDPSIGFWMTADTKDGHPERRNNVSERAIGRTFHRTDW